MTDGGREGREEAKDGGADTELKTKTPHVNVGNKTEHLDNLDNLNSF